ncbi:MAG TPA: hypothetical protein VGL55_03660 [Steroidobacteraceae bacterium]|jgi:hypothetical protein
MSTPETALRVPLTPGHPGVSAPLSAFGLLGGPLAWFVESCAGYAFSSWACFPKDQRRFAPLEGYGWTWTVVVIICIAAFVMALAALVVSRKIWQHTENERRATAAGELPIAVCRTRFLAMWGMAAGGGFAIAVAFTAVALIVLPQCAG